MVVPAVAVEAEPPTADDPLATTIGPEPAEETTPLSAEAIEIAPASDAADADAADADAADAAAGATVVAAVEAVDADEELLGRDPPAGQVRSYSGVVVRG